MLTTLQAAALAGYDPPENGLHQIRRWAREGRFPDAKETTRGWMVPESAIPLIQAAKGNRGNKSGKPRRGKAKDDAASDPADE